MMNLLAVLGMGFWLVCNVVVTNTMSIEEMQEDFIAEQNKLGKIFANTFYFPAWIIKKFSK